MSNYLGQDLSKKELLARVGNIMQIASIKPYTMLDGKSDGLRAFDITTGSGLIFSVLADKCLDIFNMTYKGINLNFVAKPGLASPQYFTNFGKELLRYFQGGFLYTCGLLNVGSPCNDNGIDYGMHGNIGHTPAEKISVTSDAEGLFQDLHKNSVLLSG